MTEVDSKKCFLLLINKADFLTPEQRYVSNCPSREATSAIWKISKTQVQLILNCTRTRKLCKGNHMLCQFHLGSLFSLHFTLFQTYSVTSILLCKRMSTT